MSYLRSSAYALVWLNNQKDQYTWTPKNSTQASSGFYQVLTETCDEFKFDFGIPSIFVKIKLRVIHTLTW
jgi:hypothetical protein